MNPTSKSPRPNILLITTDQLRYDCFGAPKSNWPQFETMTKLRSESTLLTNTYANCPICMPCRYTWLTGLYSSQTERGIGNGYDWPDYHRTMPQALQSAGYHTALIGKLHAHTVGTLKNYHLSELEPHNRLWGFDEIFECSGRAILSHGPKKPGPREAYGIKGCRYTDFLKERGLYEKVMLDNIERDQHEQTRNGLEPYRPGVLNVEDTLDAFASREMCRFVRDYNSEKPFFLHASFFAPHYPIDLPHDIFHRFHPEDMPAPAGLTDPELIRLWQENRAMYCGLVSLVDEFIGRLLRAIEDKGIMNETIILFTTDHGDMLGDHELHHKFYPHEGSCRTPLMARHPKSIPSGKIVHSLAEAADLPHTILDVAGLDEKQRSEALPESPGLSQLPVITGSEDSVRKSAYSETRGDARMLRMDRWKYIRTPGKEDLLFDVQDDPHEMKNLSGDPSLAGEIGALDKELFDRMANLRIPPLQGKDHGCQVMRGSVRGGLFKQPKA